MKSFLAQSHGWSRRIFAPYFVLAVSLLVTFVGVYYVWATTSTKDRLQFENNIQLAQTSIQTRLETYISALRAGAALFGAEELITRDNFHSFAKRLDIKNRYPGVQGLGFSAVIKPQDKDDIVASMRTQGMPGFSIKPPGDRRVYTAILYIEPLDSRNQVALGYDMFTEPVRRAAMEQARDTGDAAASGRVTLMQETSDDKQAGFLIYVPVYRKGTSPRNVAERRAALIGYVYSPFHADDLLNGALGEQEHRSIELQVYDGTELTPDNLLHQSDVNADSRTPHFTETRVIPLAGRKWTLVFTSRPEFEYGSGRYLVPISLIGGLMVSFTVFGVARSLARARDVAESSALSLAESQAALRENEARLRRFVDSNIIGVVIGDLKGRVIEANDAFLKVVGYTRQDIITGALNLTEITPPEYRPLDKAAIEEMKRTGSHPPFEKEYVRKDSSRVPVLLGTAYLAGPSQLWVGFLLDLTERKRAEVALREADQLAINAYEALLERLTALAQALGTARDLLAIYRALREFAVASVPCVGVLITLYDARRDVCGAAYAWGEGEEFDVSAMAPFPVSGTDPNTRAVKTGQVVIVNDYAQAPEGHGLVIVGARDGIQPESCMVAPLAVMGRIVGTMEVQSYEPDAYKNEHIVAIRMAANLAAAAIENVQLLESESRARALAEESNRMKDEFLATVSHELRTPLTAILGWARMLPMGGFDEATIARAIETIERNATAQARIIDDILDVSRVITGKLKMDVKRVEMSAVVDAAINSIRPAAEAKGIKLKVDIAPGEQIVSGDPDRLQQVAWNLLSNAVKFTRSGGTVSATLRRDGPEIKLTVIDSGEGISPAFLPYVFDRFRQADSSSTREHGGLGLGLAIVRHLVELHGGRVEAASEGAGKGSTFSVILPVAVSPARVEAPVAALQPTTPVMSKNGKESLSGVHVLVVDDERDTVDMVQAVLARDGATVSTACSVYEALESIARCEPDVIVSDIGMPELDGYDFIKRVRAVEKISGKHIPAIALTAYVRSDERDMAFSAGYEEHISKPVDPDMLVAAIAGLTRS